MKNIYKKIKISSSFILIILLSLISGLFRDIITLFLIILIHETGHIITSLIFKWKIENIKISIVGGYITYDEVIDKPFIEEFLISISGILIQILLFIIIYILFKYDLIDNKLYLMITKYNNAIMLFNLLPIIPLDGSKVLNVLLSLILPFKKAQKALNSISIIDLILVLIFIIYNKYFELSFIMITFVIIEKIIDNIKYLPYIFNKLLFERYTKPIKVNKSIYIDNINDFRRQINHYSYIGKKYCSEREILSKRFDLKDKI